MDIDCLVINQAKYFQLNHALVNNSAGYPQNFPQDMWVCCGNLINHLRYATINSLVAAMASELHARWPPLRYFTCRTKYWPISIREKEQPSGQVPAGLPCFSIGHNFAEFVMPEPGKSTLHRRDVFIKFPTPLSIVELWLYWQPVWSTITTLRYECFIYGFNTIEYRRLDL